MYAIGKDVEKNNKTAIEWYLKSANSGNAEAQFQLGNMYFSKRDVPKDYPQAEKWFLAAAKQGLSRAQYYLASIYYSGAGSVKQDYKKAAEQGDTSFAQLTLSSMYMKGLGVTTDYAQAYIWARVVTDQKYRRQQLLNV